MGEVERSTSEGREAADAGKEGKRGAGLPTVGRNERKVENVSGSVFLGHLSHETLIAVREEIVPFLLQ